MKAYKVFEKANGLYVSTGTGLTHKDTLLLTYTPGEIIIATQGTIGIFIFKTYEDATKYGGYYTVLEIETLAPVKPVTKVISELEQLSGDIFKPATYKKNLIPIGKQDDLVPDNSFLCRKIRVIGLVA